MTDTPSPAPLVVCTGVEHCATKHEHPVRLITSGSHAYAYPEDGGNDDLTVAYDEATRSFTATCGQPTDDDTQPCGGTVTWKAADLDTTTSADFARWLTAYGHRVES